MERPGRAGGRYRPPDAISQPVPAGPQMQQPGYYFPVPYSPVAYYGPEYVQPATYPYAVWPGQLSPPTYAVLATQRHPWVQASAPSHLHTLQPTWPLDQSSSTASGRQELSAQPSTSGTAGSVPTANGPVNTSQHAREQSLQWQHSLYSMPHSLGPASPMVVSGVSPPALYSHIPPYGATMLSPAMPYYSEQYAVAVARSEGQVSSSASAAPILQTVYVQLPPQQQQQQQQWPGSQQPHVGPPPRRRGARFASARAEMAGGSPGLMAGNGLPQVPLSPRRCSLANGINSSLAACTLAECDSACECDSDGDGGLSMLSAAATPFSPNFEIVGEAAEDWRSLTEGLLQKIVLRLGTEDVKQVRLVGRHWRAVVDHNLEQLSPSSMQSAIIVARFQNLRALHLTGCANVRNRDLMLIAKSGRRLHTLTLGDDTTKPWVTNKGLAFIAQMPTLTALHLQDCNSVTNNGIASLNALHELSSLSLKGCRKLTNSGLESLQVNTNLTSLNLFGCIKIGDRGLAPLTSLRLLTLNLGLTRIKDEGIGYLAAITSLRELSFSHEEMTDSGLKQLSHLTNLQSLALREIRSVSGEALVQVIPQLSRLQSLDLFRNWSFKDDHMIRCLDFVGSVTALDLRGTAVTQEGISQLTQLVSLQKLCVQPQHVDMWEPYLLVLANLTQDAHPHPQLVSLTINNCSVISMRSLGSLRPLARLQELDLSDDKFLDGLEPREVVNSEHVEVMASLSSLTSLDLSRRPIAEEHLAVLAERLPCLRSLIVVGCPVRNEELQSLQRRFPDLAIHRKPLGDGSSCSSSEVGS